MKRREETLEKMDEFYKRHGNGVKDEDLLYNDVVALMTMRAVIMDTQRFVDRQPSKRRKTTDDATTHILVDSAEKSKKATSGGSRNQTVRG